MGGRGSKAPADGACSGAAAGWDGQEPAAANPAAAVARRQYLTEYAMANPATRFGFNAVNVVIPTRCLPILIHSDRYGMRSMILPMTLSSLPVIPPFRRSTTAGR